MANQTDIYSAFFDQVLDEIVLGNTDQGIGRLVGMLDGLALHECNLGKARRALNRHALRQLLFEAPFKQQTELPTPAVLHLDPAELRLTKAIKNLTILRALHLRSKFAGEKVTRAWQSGQKICLLGPAKITLRAAFEPRDRQTITIVERGGSELAALVACGHARFDLICAADAPDGCDKVELEQLLSDLHKLLAPRGTAIVAILLPHHMGSGWAQACLNWRPYVHTEAALRDAARAAGLSPQLFRDATGCLAWCMLQRTPDAIDREIENVPR